MRKANGRRDAGKIRKRGFYTIETIYMIIKHFLTLEPFMMIIFISAWVFSLVNFCGKWTINNEQHAIGGRMSGKHVIKTATPKFVRLMFSVR